MDTTKKDPFATTLQSGAIISDQSKGGTGQVITPAPIVPNPLGTTVDASNIGTQPLVFPQKQETPIPTFPTPSINEQAKSFAESTQVSTPTPAETQQTQALSQWQKLSEKMFGKSATQTAAETTQGIPTKTQAVTDIQSQIHQLQNEATAAQLKSQNIGGSTSFVGGEQGRIQREATIKALQLNSFLYAAQGNLATAQQMADKAVSAKFDPIEAQIKYTKDWIDMNKDTLSREDKKRADAMTLTLNERTRLLEQQKEDMKTIIGWGALAGKNGATTSQVQAIQNETDLKKAANLFAPFSKDPIATQKAVDEHLKARAEIDKLNAETRANGAPTITNPQASQYSGALSTILGSGKFTKEQKASLVASINSGEDPVTVIKNNAKNIMGQTEATTVTKYETAKSSLQDIQQNLKDFYSTGGKTDIFSGNYEKVINKLGNLDNPALVDLATQIQANLQVYRNAVSGTAYSAQEGADIASIFPGINKSEGLNTAILNGRMKAFDSTIDGAYRATLGSSYDKLKTSSTKVPQTVMSNGQNYEVGKTYTDKSGNWTVDANGKWTKQ